MVWVPGLGNFPEHPLLPCMPSIYLVLPRYLVAIGIGFGPKELKHPPLPKPCVLVVNYSELVT